MATTISVKVGNLTGSVVFQDDVKAVEVLRRYYLYMKLGPADATDQAKLNAVAASIGNEIARYSVHHYIDERRVVLEQTLLDEARAAADFVSSIN